MKTAYLALVFPFLSGCVICYPCLQSTPAVHVPPDVRAFRVQTDSDFFGMLSIPKHRAEIAEMTVEQGSVPTQWDTHFAWDMLVFPVRWWHERELKVVLYKPGCEPVEITGGIFGAWRKPRMEWKKADTPLEREIAVDRLCCCFVEPWHWSGELQNAWGTTLMANVAARDALAREYEQIATEFDVPATNKERLLAKARRIRQP